jgi:uncharacterized protein (DUF1778 family)
MRKPIQIRFSENERDLIEKALIHTQHKTISEFVREIAVKEAINILNNNK